MLSGIIEGDTGKIGNIFLATPTLVLLFLFAESQSTALLLPLLISVIDFVILIAYTRNMSLVIGLSQESMIKEVNKMKNKSMREFGKPKNYPFGKLLALLSVILFIFYLYTMCLLCQRISTYYYVILFVSEMGLFVYMFSSAFFMPNFLKHFNIKINKKGQK